MKLHIGCGKRDFGPDWTHIDGGEYPHVESNDIWLNEIYDRNVDVIYASHLLEYFDREDAVSLLDQWYRVLKSNGILRLAVPDFHGLVYAYNKLGYSVESLIGPLYGKMQMNDETIYHKTVYDFESLAYLLKNVGFRIITRWNWRETEHADIDDHSQAYLPHMQKDTGHLISLNVEAVK